MADTRQQDSPSKATPPRTERIYSEQDMWYFRTRENEAIGPFRYRSEAESNLDKFMAGLKDQLEALTE